MGLRDPGSTIDVENPTARVADRFFKGTGTSQAAAVVSGAAALVVQQRPTITPDQVKALLTGGAQRLERADPVAQGNGMLDLKFVRDRATPSVSAAAQGFAYATGTGSLEAARGTTHVQNQAGEILTGEQDAFGGTWEGRMWSGGTWNGRMWSGRRWSGGTWSGGTWTGRRWSGDDWAGRRWSGRRWSGGEWN